MLLPIPFLAASGHEEDGSEVVEIGLETLVNSPEKFVGVHMVRYLINGVRERPDPGARLVEGYYLVKVSDSDFYSREFVISSDDLSNYSRYIGATVLFRLVGRLEPERAPPYGRLITNILVSKTDGRGQYFTIYIRLAEPDEETTTTTTTTVNQTTTTTVSTTTTSEEKTLPTTPPGDQAPTEGDRRLLLGLAGVVLVAILLALALGRRSGRGGRSVVRAGPEGAG